MDRDLPAFGRVRARPAGHAAVLVVQSFANQTASRILVRDGIERFARGTSARSCYPPSAKGTSGQCSAANPPVTGILVLDQQHHILVTVGSVPADPLLPSLPAAQPLQAFMRIADDLVLRAISPVRTNAGEPIGSIALFHRDDGSVRIQDDDLMLGTNVRRHIGVLVGGHPLWLVATPHGLAQAVDAPDLSWFDQPSPRSRRAPAVRWQPDRSAYRRPRCRADHRHRS